MNETMRREIDAQPEYLAAGIPLLREAVVRLDLPGTRIFAGGCGDSWYAAGAMAGLFGDLGIDYHSVSAMDLACYRRVGPGDLAVLISVSGGTRRTVQAAARVRAAGGRTLAVTCEPASALALACDGTLALPFRPISRATPHTLDYSVTLAALASLAERLGNPAVVELDRMPEVVARAAEAARPIAAAVAAEVPASARVFVLGAGPGLATAAYGAAKLHEAGGYPACHAELENAAHGLNFCLEAGDLAVVLATDAAAAERARALVPGLAQLAGTVMVVGDTDAADGLAHVLDTEAPGGWQAQAAAAVALQELCLALATRHGRNVEAPRGGRPRGRLHLAVQRGWMSSPPLT